MSDWFLAYWSNNPPANVNEYMGIYGGIVGFVFITAILRGLIFYRVSSAVFIAPMCFFALLATSDLNPVASAPRCHRCWRVGGHRDDRAGGSRVFPSHL